MIPKIQFDPLKLVLNFWGGSRGGGEGGGAGGPRPTPEKAKKYRVSLLYQSGSPENHI